MQELIGSALFGARQGIRCSVAENPADALRSALELAAGVPVLFVYEKLPLAHDALAAVGAVARPEADRTVAGAAAAVAADAAAVADAAAAAVADAAECLVCRYSGHGYYGCCRCGARATRGFAPGRH